MDISNKRMAAAGVVAAALLLVILAVFVLHQASETRGRHVTVGSFSRAIDYSPFIIARKKGWLDEAAEKHGAKIDYVEFNSLPAINEALAAGKLDVVFEAEPPAIIGKSASINVRIVGISASLRQEIIARNETGAVRVGDLGGKKIAVLAGSSSHYGLLNSLEKAGISEKGVEIFDMAPPEARAAFETGRIDAWAVWPPWVEQQQVSGKGRVLDGSTASIQSIVAARGQFADENPELLKDLLEAVSRAKTWIGENEAAAQEIVAGELGLPLDVVRLSWPKHDFQAKLTPAGIADIQDKADFLFGRGIVKSRVNASTLVEAK